MNGISPGADNAFVLQVEQHHPDCYGWALHCCNRDKEKAAEILQTAYLKILEKRHTFKGASSFKTWVFIVIRNTALDAQKGQQKRSKMMVADQQLRDAASGIEPEHGFDQKQQSLFFLQALDRLSPRQKQLMQLVFYHDFSIDQAAKVLHISPGSARRHYDRAKKMLAAWLLKNRVEEYK
jgi:RNA polymerase sigma-70 factor, ECF subfamily